GVFTMDAALNHSYSLLGLAGAIGAFVSVGAGVVSFVDTSDTFALLGDTPDSSASGALVVTDFETVDVTATSNQTVKAAAGSGAIGAAAAGVSVVYVDMQGDTKAAVGSGSLIGTEAGGSDAVGDLSVNAVGTIDVGGQGDTGDTSMVIAVSAGLGGFSGGFAILKESSDVAALIGSDSVIHLTGALDVDAAATRNLVAEADGGALGVVGIGVMSAATTVAGATTARLGAGSTVRSGSVGVAATADNSVSSTVIAGAGGIVAVDINAANATIDADVTAELGEGSDIATSTTGGGTGNIDVVATSNMHGDTTAFGIEVGVGTAGASTATTTINPSVSAVAGADVTLDAEGAVNIVAAHTMNASLSDTTLKGASSAAEPSGGGVIAANGGTATSEASANVTANIGNDATIKGELGLIVRSEAQNYAYADAETITVGLVGVGTVEADSTSNGVTQAWVGDNSQVTARSLDVESIGENRAEAYAKAVTGGVLTGTGAIATANTTPMNEAWLGSDVYVLTDAEVDVIASEVAEADATAKGTSVSVIDFSSGDSSQAGSSVATAYLGDPQSLDDAKISSV
ncbi:MAG: hypothetical protein AAFW74_11710, partial [Pseudomonadota bacterium]